MLNCHLDLRNRLGDRRVYRIDQSIEIVHELKDRFENTSDDDLLGINSVWSSWYRRHRSKDIVPMEEELSVEDKKAMIRERILKMRTSKREKLII